MAWLIRHNWSIVDGGTLPIGQAVKSRNLMQHQYVLLLTKKGQEKSVLPVLSNC
jgi:hypothetical protein